MSKLTKFEAIKVADLLEKVIGLLGDVRATVAGVARQPGSVTKQTWRVPVAPPRKPRKPTRRKPRQRA
jgi:hypothetical protein